MTPKEKLEFELSQDKSRPKYIAQVE